MNTLRFFFKAHKWVGVCAATFLAVTAVTGFLLLLKKEFDWIQPPTQKGAEGTIEEFISIDEAWQRVQAADHPDFRSPDDIDRIDVRPDRRVYKVRSKHNHAEIQVDAVTGAILSTDTRTSDWLEQIHDGSWVGKPFHDYVMPLVAICVMFLVFSGLWLWITPMVRRRRRKRQAAKQESA